MRVCRSVLWRDSMSRCRSCTICCRCWIRCSRCCARVSICSFRDGRAPAAGDVPGLDGAAMRGSGCLVMAGRCGGAARWISGRGAAICGAAGRGGAAIRGAACGAMAGRCGGGAARNAGAAGRAIAGGAAGRAIAGGGPAGRAMAGGAAGRAAGAAAPPGPWPLPSWANEPVLTAIAETPRKNAATRTPARKHDLNSLVLRRPEMSTRKRRNRSLLSLICIAMLRRRCNSSQP